MARQLICLSTDFTVSEALDAQLAEVACRMVQEGIPSIPLAVKIDGVVVAGALQKTTEWARIGVCSGDIFVARLTTGITRFIVDRPGLIDDIAKGIAAPPAVEEPRLPEPAFESFF